MVFEGAEGFGGTDHAHVFVDRGVVVLVLSYLFEIIDLMSKIMGRFLFNLVVVIKLPEVFNTSELDHMVFFSHVQLVMLLHIVLTEAIHRTSFRHLFLLFATIS